MFQRNAHSSWQRYTRGKAVGREESEDIRNGLCYEHRKEVELGIYSA
jgi:hypothetical protein